MTHTPGPWVWRWKSGSLHQKGTDRQFGATVLSPTYDYDSGIGIEVSDDDDRLIAAAPDLLAALKSLVPGPDDDAMDYIPCVKAGRAAIAKVEGRAP